MAPPSAPSGSVASSAAEKLVSRACLRKRENRRTREGLDRDFPLPRSASLASVTFFSLSPPLPLSLTRPPLFETQADFERRADPKSSEAAALLEEMRAHVKRVRERERGFAISKSVPPPPRRRNCSSLTRKPSFLSLSLSLSLLLSFSSPFYAARGPPPRRGPQALLLDARIQRGAADLHRRVQGETEKEGDFFCIALFFFHLFLSSNASSPPHDPRIEKNAPKKKKNSSLRKTLAALSSGRWCATTPGRPRSCASWSSPWMRRGSRGPALRPRPRSKG